MPGLATVISRIRTDLNRGTDFDSRIRLAIHDAIVYYRTERLGFNSKRKTFIVSAEYTSLTANWLEVDTLALERSDYVNPLCEKTYLWIHDRARDPDFTDEPLHFAIQNHQLRLYPAPDQTYSVQMSYLYDLGGVLTDNAGVSLSASDSFSNAWLTQGELLIRQHAMADLYENYIDGPESMQKADRCSGQASLHLNQLKRRANREQGGGMVEPWL